MKAVQRLFWNRSEARLRAGWRVLLQFVAFLVLFFGGLIGIAMLILLPMLGFSSFEELDAAEAAGQVPYWLILIPTSMMLLAALVSVALAGRFLDRRPLADFGFHLNRSWWIDLGFGLMLGALFAGAIFAIGLAAGWITITGTFHVPNPEDPFALAILAGLAATLMVPIAEAVVFRGYQITNLAEGLNLRGIGPGRAIVLAWLLSLLFSVFWEPVFGSGPLYLLNTVLAMIWFGAGYVLTGQLAIPIGVHMGMNIFMDHVFGLDPTGLAGAPFATFIATAQVKPNLWAGGASAPLDGLLTTAAVITGILLTAAWVRIRYGGVRLHLPLAQPPAMPGMSMQPEMRPAVAD